MRKFADGELAGGWLVRDNAHVRFLEADCQLATAWPAKGLRMMRFRVLFVLLAGLHSGCGNNSAGKNVLSNPAPSASAPQGAKAFFIEKCTFTIVDKDIRPDLQRIDREIKQTVSFDASDHLICTKSLVYTPPNKEFSNHNWVERVLLRDLDPNRVVVVLGETKDDWVLKAHTTGDRALVTDKNGKKITEMIIWSTEEKTARRAAETLSLLIREAGRQPGSEKNAEPPP
jgi:hypothetical protein